MSGKVEVLGVQIDNVSAIEAIRQTEEFLKTDALSCIGTITGSVLMEAGQNEEYKRKIENLDLSIIMDRDVLDAAGIVEAERRLAGLRQLQFNKTSTNRRNAVFFCQISFIFMLHVLHFCDTI